MQAVLETPAFSKDAEDAGLSAEEIEIIIAVISRDPKAGDLMAGTGGARKIRLPGRGKGKRGGYRVVTYFGGDDIPVFLLGLFSKGERANLSKAERNELRRELAGLADDYRRSVGAKVAEVKRRTVK